MIASMEEDFEFTDFRILYLSIRFLSLGGSSISLRELCFEGRSLGLFT